MTDAEDDDSAAAPKVALVTHPQLPNLPIPCKLCSPDVEADWITAVEVRTKISLPTALELLNQQQGYRNVCYIHRECLRRALGLRKMESIVELDNALKVVHREQGDPWGLKIGPHYFLFQKDRVPSRPNEYISTLRFTAI